MVGGCSLSRQPSGRPSISPSRSTPVISTTPISGRAPTGAKRRLRPRSTAPEPSISLIRPLRATRSTGATLKARTMSRLPTGVGLSAMKSRISSRVGRRPSERRALARVLPACSLLGGFRWTRLPPLAGSRFGPAVQSFLLALGRRRSFLFFFFGRGCFRGRCLRRGDGLFLVLARSFALAAGFGGKQLACLLQRHRVRLGLAGQRRVDAAMADIGAVAAAEQIDRRAVRRMVAKHAQRRRAAPATLLRLGEQRHRAVEADGEHVVVLAERLVEILMLDVWAEAATGGDDLLAAVGMEAELARQGQKLQRRGEIDFHRRRAFGQAHALGLLALVAFAALDVGAVRALAHADGKVGRGIDAELARPGSQLVTVPVAVLEGERPRIAAIGIVRAADEGAKLAEAEVEASDVAARAEPRVVAVGRRREEVGAEILVQRLQHLGDGEILRAGHGGGEVAPEILQHFLPLQAAVGDLVELVLEVGGEIVLDIFPEEALEEGGHDAAAVLGKEALLVEPHVFAVLQHL